MHSQEGWAHFAAEAIDSPPRKAGVELPAFPRRGNLRLHGSGYKPSRNWCSLRCPG